MELLSLFLVLSRIFHEEDDEMKLRFPSPISFGDSVSAAAASLRGFSPVALIYVFRSSLPNHLSFLSLDFTLPLLVVVANRFIFELLLIIKDNRLFKQEDRRWFLRELFFIGMALLDGGFPSSLLQIAGGRWSALSLTRVSERRAFVHVVGCVDAFLNEFFFLWAYGPRCS
ncbi:hypothetical protein DY000_02031872 [Brassica cretica]|uniref:Uncharacterized protein n=1 Tax=Brassica cretica TaxID=69181 RepID=A0ABQ7DL30_BRACR|nr:hypothetical protein DY000_02031872 [Brassica cretica]